MDPLRADNVSDEQRVSSELVFFRTGFSAFAMTPILDSVAHFYKRTEEVGLSDRGRQSALNAGYATLGRLAFGVGQPGMPVRDLEFNRFATNLLGAMSTMRDISALRRFLFESQTLVMAQLHEQVSNPEMQMTRKMPPGWNAKPR